MQKAGFVISTFLKVSWHTYETDSVKGTVFQFIGENDGRCWGGEHPAETALIWMQQLELFTDVFTCSPLADWDGLQLGRVDATGTSPALGWALQQWGEGFHFPMCTGCLLSEITKLDQRRGALFPR